MERPHDNQPVRIRFNIPHEKLSDNQLAIYNSTEDMFMIANDDGTLNESVDFVFTQFIKSWTPASLKTLKK
jgi:hypothetical protein